MREPVRATFPEPGYLATMSFGEPPAGSMGPHTGSEVSAERAARPIGAALLGRQREIAASALAAVSLPLLTWVLLHGFETRALHITLFAYLLTAVSVAAVGGVWPAMAAAIAGFLLANWFFTPPVRTWTIADADDLFSLFTFLVVSVAVGYLVGVAARRSAEARRARAQAEALAVITARRGSGLDSDLEGVVVGVREAFSLSAVGIWRKTDEGWTPLAEAGDADPRSGDRALEMLPFADGYVMTYRGGTMTGDDRRVLRAFAEQAAEAVERADLEREARAAEALAATDRLRTALLRAVSHDLRTPLATIKASITSLVETDVEWNDRQRNEFLMTALGETERLDRLVGRLLDASRIQSGAVTVSIEARDLEEVIASALRGLGPRARSVVLEAPLGLPPVATDAALLERVVANLVENALTWSPPGIPVRVVAREEWDDVEVRVVDHGPGIPQGDREAVFEPFQRLGDSPRSEGVGLGLAVANGLLEAMDCRLDVETTPGGGTTMVIRIPRKASAPIDEATGP